MDAIAETEARNDLIRVSQAGHFEELSILAEENLRRAGIKQLGKHVKESCQHVVPVVGVI